jgi:hypothetical protein
MSNRAHRRHAARRPSRAEVDLVARVSAMALGCTCVAVDVRMRPGQTTVDIAHEPGCPAEHAGHIPVLITGTHRADTARPTCDHPPPT